MNQRKCQNLYVHPFFQLLKKGVQWEWTETHKEAFELVQTSTNKCASQKIRESRICLIKYTLMRVIM